MGCVLLLLILGEIDSFGCFLWEGMLMMHRSVQTESGNAAAPVYGFGMEEAVVPVNESVRFLMDTVRYSIVVAAWRLIMGNSL